MTIKSTLLHALGATVALGVALAATPVAAQSDADVKSLIDQLDSAELAARWAARDTLIRFIQQNRLTPDQFEILRTYPPTPPLELSKRKDQVLATWTLSFPDVQRTIDHGIGMKRVDEFDELQFTFGRFFVRPRNLPFLAELQVKYEAVRNALLRADGPLALAELDALRDFVFDNFNQFAFLSAGGDPPPTRRQVIAQIDAARMAAQRAIREIQIGSNNVQRPPEDPVPVQRHGALGVGRTLHLTIGSVIRPGGLDIFLPSYEVALSVPPVGYIFVGDVFDLLATDGLEIAGSVSIGIEYALGDNLLGNEVDDPAALRLARMANGRAELLDDFFNDLDRHVITAIYTPESSGLRLDQFGEFAIVRAVPEPWTLGLVVIGLAAAGAAEIRRRRRRGAW